MNNHNECCGEQSPLARLYECNDNGYVLLIGVQHRNNTSLHLAEYRFQVNANMLRKVSQAGASILDPQLNTRQYGFNGMIMIIIQEDFR